MALGPRLGHRRVQGRAVPLDAISETTQLAEAKADRRKPVRQVALASLAHDRAELLGRIVNGVGLVVRRKQPVQRPPVRELAVVHISDEPPAHRARRISPRS